MAVAAGSVSMNPTQVTSIFPSCKTHHGPPLLSSVRCTFQSIFGRRSFSLAGPAPPMAAGEQRAVRPSAAPYADSVAGGATARTPIGASCRRPARQPRSVVPRLLPGHRSGIALASPPALRSLHRYGVPGTQGKVRFIRRSAVFLPTLPCCFWSAEQCCGLFCDDWRRR